MSQGFVQQMTIERQVKFALTSPGPDAAAFVDVSGINFNVGGKVLALRELHLKAADGFCDIKPLFHEKGVIPHRGSLFQRARALSKDLLVGVMVHARKVSTRLPANCPVSRVAAARSPRRCAVWRACASVRAS